MNEMYRQTKFPYRIGLRTLRFTTAS